MYYVKIEVNQCICVNFHTGIFMVYRYFYGLPVFLRYVGFAVYVTIFGKPTTSVHFVFRYILI